MAVGMLCPPLCRRAILDVSRGWHAALVAAPELVPTACLSCMYDYAADGRLRLYSCGTHPKLIAALGEVQSLSPRTLSVRLEGFDWCLVSSASSL